MARKIKVTNHVNDEPSEAVAGIPTLTAEFIRLLDEAYPSRCVLPGETQESAHRYAGKRELVDEILAWQAEGHRSQ